MRKEKTRIELAQVRSGQNQILYRYRTLLSCSLLCVLFSGAVLYLCAQVWTETVPDTGKNVTAALLMLLTVVCCAAANLFLKKTWSVWTARLIPWISMFILSGFGGYWAGIRLWINALITRWNSLNDQGTALFQIQESAAAVLAVSLLFAVCVTKLAWWIVYRHHMFAGIIFGMLVFWMSLFSGVFQWTAGAVLLLGMLCLCMSGRDLQPSGKHLAWLAASFCLLFLGMAAFPGDQIAVLADARVRLEESIHTFRYGEDSLPQGDLNLADKLHENDREMLRVTTESQIAMYLRGFVGGEYDDGVWKELPGSAYGGDYAGMLKWLNKHDFDPLRQTAQYYRLSGEETAPDSIAISVDTTGASRSYLYTPAGIEQVDKIKVSSVKDYRLSSPGVRGTDHYTGEERTGIRPAELEVAQTWVTDPQTDEQEAYCEAESVYREFVYANYTAVDAELEEVISELFWEDYDSENDGIYSAISQIRAVLKQTVQYTETSGTVPKGTDPILWFLTEAKEGNAVFYASTAVQALRLHGIPARYVEGYYLPEAAGTDAADAERTLTGKNAHAWVEVYFDGIGWLPLDVTPGYYYDAIALQQMISAPDDVLQDVAFEKDAQETNTLADTGSTAPDRSDVKEIARDAALLGLGIIAVAAIFLTILFAAAEIARLIAGWYRKKKFRRLSVEERTLEKEKQLYKLLHIWKIDACLGWRTGEVDRELTERFEEIESGDYCRVCALIEKTVYGGILLELYEERTLDHFLGKLTAVKKGMPWKTRMRLRYRDVI